MQGRGEVTATVIVDGVRYLVVRFDWDNGKVRVWNEASSHTAAALLDLPEAHRLAIAEAILCHEHTATAE